MIITCHKCQAKVDATIIGSHDSYDREEMPEPVRISLLECPACKSTIVAEQSEFYVPEEGPVWCDATRIWPQPAKFLEYSIPTIVRESLVEAEKCMQAGAFTAAVTMCGKALEGICRHYKTKNRFLGGGIEELREMGIIDNRLYQWSEELRKHRNIAAHAGDERIVQRDASDLHIFVIAICEYIFDLTAKFEQFKNRQITTKKPQKDNGG